MSCENPDDIGLDEVVPDVVGAHYTELNLPVSNVLTEEIRSSKRGFVWNGSYQDPVFGNLSAEAFLTLQLQDCVARFDPSLNPQVDSAFFRFAIDEFYGVDFSNFRLQILQLSEPLPETDTFRIGDDFDQISGRVIAEGTFNLSDTGGIANGKDTILKVTANPIFRSSFFDGATPETFYSASSFVNYLPGIYLAAEGPDGLIRILNREADTDFRVYFTDDSSTTESTLIRFFLASLSSRLTDNNINYFYNMTADRTGYPTEFIANPKTSYSVQDSYYQQSLVGILPKYTLNPFLELIDSIGQKILVNDATLSLGFPRGNDVLPPTEAHRFPFATSSNGFRVFADTTNFLLGIQRPGSIPYGIQNELEYNYTVSGAVNVTDYLQSVIDGTAPEESFFLYPGDFETRPARAIFNTEDVQLRIQYSVVK